MANTNSAKVSGEKGDTKAERHAALTFTEVPGTQEVDTNHEKDHDRDVDGQVLDLNAYDQLLSMCMRNHLPVTHIGIPVRDQNRSSSDFTGNTNSGGLRKAVSIPRE